MRFCCGIETRWINQNTMIANASSFPSERKNSDELCPQVRKNRKSIFSEYMLQKSAFTKEFEQNYIYQLKVAHLNSSGSTSNVHNTYICTTCKIANDAHKMDRIMVGGCWNKYKVNKWEGRKEARMNVRYYRCYQCVVIVLQAQNETPKCARSLQMLCEHCNNVMLWNDHLCDANEL